MSTETDKILQIEQNIRRVIVGHESTVRLTVAALVAGGHVLLEDVPGTGKTMLAKALAASISAKYARIQFTPDLLPSDVTGLDVYDPASGKFVFRKGPVFTDILLADEINRATPRTQSGLLECMEERQVTVDGVTRKLEEPFFVIATQNPIETAGTFPLPEAQLDRFIVKLPMNLPGREEEIEIMKRFASDNAPVSISPAADPSDILKARESAAKVRVPDAVAGYLADIVIATRKRDDLVMGVSPRGSLACLRIAKVLALLAGRDFVAPEDIKAAAVPTLSHRCHPAHSYGAAADTDQIIRGILMTVPVPTEDFS